MNKFITRGEIPQTIILMPCALVYACQIGATKITKTNYAKSDKTKKLEAFNS